MAAENCPDCGTPPSPAGRPGCNCPAPGDQREPGATEGALDAADAALDAAGSALDDLLDAFHPMRVRPYFTGEAKGPDAAPASVSSVPEGVIVPPEGVIVPPEGVIVPPDAAPARSPDPAETAELPPLDLAGFPVAEPPAAQGLDPGEGLRPTPVDPLFQPPTDPGEPAPGMPPDSMLPALLPAVDMSPHRGPSHARRKRWALLAAGGTVIVLATTAFGVAQLGESNHKSDRADATPTVADPTAPAPSANKSGGESGSPSGKPTGSQSAKASAGSHASRGAKGKNTAGPGSTTIDGKVGSTATGQGGSGDDGGSASPAGPPVLRNGDSGPEVVELQKRLRQVPFIYFLGSTDGKYDDDVENAVRTYQDDYDVKGDPAGVYGPNTRKSLESRTDEPS